jgi:hypothetical protein
MTTRSFASLAFKLLGTYMLLQSIAALQVIPMNRYSFPRNITVLLPFLFAITVGIALIAKSNLFAQYAVATEGQVEEVVPVVKATQAVAFSVLGVFFSVFAVSRLVYLIARPMTIGTGNPWVFQPVMTFRASWPELADNLVLLAMGAYLFFGAGSLSRLWHRIQE